MKRKLFQLSILILVVVLAGCRGSQQTKLIGVWENIPFIQPGDTVDYWKFYSGDLLEVFSLDESIEPADTLSKIAYQYEVSGSVFSIFVAEGGENEDYVPGAGDPRGEYWVDELSNDNFKITKRKHPDGSTQSVYLRIELVKR
jgi:hypothetical protein